MGGGSGMVPFWTERSEWHTPDATIFTLHSPGPGDAISMSSWTWTSSPTPFSTAAVTMAPPGSVGPPSVPPEARPPPTIEGRHLPPSFSVLPLRRSHRVPEHDRRREHERAGDEAAEDRRPHPTVEAHGEAGREEDAGDEEEPVP